MTPEKAENEWTKNPIFAIFELPENGRIGYLLFLSKRALFNFY